MGKTARTFQQVLEKSEVQRLREKQKRTDLHDFLRSTVIFPPDDTASNLDPGDLNTEGLPQRGHGSIKLTVLFNNPG